MRFANVDGQRQNLWSSAHEMAGFRGKSTANLAGFDARLIFASHNQRALRIVAGLGANVLDATLPVLAKIVETKAVFFGFVRLK